MEEIEFCIGCEIAHWIIRMNVKKRLLLSNPDNIEFFTICKSINSGGVKIPLMLILSSTLILKK